MPQYSFRHRLLLSTLSLFILVGASTNFAADRPNVLFISIDDLNDWVSVYGGHPAAITPNVERFVNQGAVVFQNAHGAGSVCGPSRSAMLSGFMPQRTGLYGNKQNMLDAPLVQANATLPEYFSKHGYNSYTMGKIYHKHDRPTGSDPGHWAFDTYHSRPGGSPADPNHVTSRNRNIIDGKPGPPSEHTGSGGSEFAWGPTRDGKEKTRDYQVAQWAANQLQEEHDKPFFLAVGLSRPHLPFYVPQEFFDLYPKGKSYAPPMRPDDLDDILTPKGKIKFSPSSDYLWLKQNNMFDAAARAYLAGVSYADACLGVIFEGLRNSPHADNTIVVVWGDHGWHLGEKLRYRKASGWSESTRMPLIISLPNMIQRQDCQRTVSMIDFYPTLVDLCGLPAKSNLDGRSIAPLLANPAREWPHPSITIHGEGNASIRDERYRYIRYVDGTEEFYDLASDPQEWMNLAGQMTPQTEAAKARLGALLPSKFKKGVVPKIGTKGNNALDMTIKPGRKLSNLN